MSEEFAPALNNHPLELKGQLKIETGDPTQYGVYSTGTARKHTPGTRYRIMDRIFKYGKASGAMVPKQGGQNDGVYSGVTGGNVTARAIGDIWLDILLDATTGAAAWFGTKNNMVGGFWSQPDTANSQFRYIMGHEKGSNGATIKVYLDGPITRTMIATSFMEVAQNPYNQLSQSGSDMASFMGVPTTAVASGSYAWFQSWGPAWMNPNTPVADTANWRTVVFHQSGSVQSFDDASAENGHQVAGFVIDKTSGDNPPFIFLQISP